MEEEIITIKIKDPNDSSKEYTYYWDYKEWLAFQKFYNPMNNPESLIEKMKTEPKKDIWKEKNVKYL